MDDEHNDEELLLAAQSLITQSRAFYLMTVDQDGNVAKALNGEDGADVMLLATYAHVDANKVLADMFDSADRMEL